MASPEQNALLALQLFGAPAAQFNQQNDARTNLAYKLMAMQREEQLKRELTTQQDERAFELAKMQAGREDARNQTTLQFNREQNESQERRAKTGAEESARKQKDALSERDKADILNEFDRDYAKYVDATEAAKRPVKKREDFPETRAGLGQMQAETASAVRAYQENLLKQAATTGAQRIQRLQTALKTAVDRETELSKPTPEDEKIARAQATATIKKAIANDIDRAYEHLTPAQKTKGLAAIAAGDMILAAEHLGAEVVNAYDALFTQTLMALPGMKVRMQEKTTAARQRQEIQNVYEKADAAYSGAAGTNPFIGEQLDKLTPLQMIQSPPQTPPKSDEDKVRAKVPARGSTTPLTGGAKPVAAAQPSALNMMATMGGGYVPPAPVIVPAPSVAEIPVETAASGSPYSVFSPSSGSSVSDALIRRPLEREMATFDTIYKGDVPADAQKRRLQSLMQILHGADYANPESRAVARTQLYQLLGMNPGGN